MHTCTKRSCVTKIITLFVVAQSLSHVQLFASSWTIAHHTSLSFTICRNLLRLMSLELVMPSKNLSSVTLFSSFLQSLVVLGGFFVLFCFVLNESALCIRWAKYWSFSFSISPSNEYSGLISFRIDWFVLPVVQGTLKSLLQHHSSKAAILKCSAFLWSNSHIHT